MTYIFVLDIVYFPTCITVFRIARQRSIDKVVRLEMRIQDDATQKSQELHPSL